MNQNIYEAIYKVNHADGSGSCFYLKKYNVFVSNYHVVKGFKQVAIQNRDKDSFLANVIMVNDTLDIALLVGEGDFSHLPELSLAEIENLSIGQKINVAGYPFGMPFTVTEGTISSPKQLMNNLYYIQTDAAVNPGNSGGPMLNEKNEIIAITVSKINDADNMGFGIPVTSLQKILDKINEIDRNTFNVQCSGCESFITQKEEYCSVCGNKLAENIFEEVGLTNLAVFCEKAIEEMGINPILARVGYEVWKFHKEKSEIRIFVYERSYLFCTSPINILPKKDLEPVLKFLLGDEIRPYQLGLSDNLIYLSYRVHISDIFSDSAEEIQKNITKMAFKANELAHLLHETYACDFSEYSKKD